MSTADVEGSAKDACVLPAGFDLLAGTAPLPTDVVAIQWVALHHKGNVLAMFAFEGDPTLITMQLFSAVHSINILIGLHFERLVQLAGSNLPLSIFAERWVD